MLFGQGGVALREVQRSGAAMGRDACGRVHQRGVCQDLVHRRDGFGWLARLRSDACQAEQ
jgi:hypothetical protein